MSAKRRSTKRSAGPRKRLKQLPMFLSPELAAEVARLGSEARKIAERLARRVVADDRTWLEVFYRAARAEGSVLEDVLRRNRHQAATNARGRAYYEIKTSTTTSLTDIALVIDRHHTSVMDAIRKHGVRLKLEAEQRRAVESHITGEAGRPA